MKDATQTATIALWITAGFMVLGGILVLTVRTRRQPATEPDRVEMPTV